MGWHIRDRGGCGRYPSKTSFLSTCGLSASPRTGYQVWRPAGPWLEQASALAFDESASSFIVWARFGQTVSLAIRGDHQVNYTPDAVSLETPLDGIPERTARHSSHALAVPLTLHVVLDQNLDCARDKASGARSVIPPSPARCNHREEVIGN